MAETWNVTITPIGASITAAAYANTKSMIHLYNNQNSSRILRVYRVYNFNNFITAANGPYNPMQIRKLSNINSATGTAITPTAYDTNNTALNTIEISAGTNSTTPLYSSILRRFLYSTDEPTGQGSSIDEFEILVPFAEVWNSGYGDSNIEPIVCRAGQGLDLYNVSGTNGTAGCEIEFTNSAT
jgi:hypothetical protein